MQTRRQFFGMVGGALAALFGVGYTKLTTRTTHMSWMMAAKTAPEMEWPLITSEREWKIFNDVYEEHISTWHRNLYLPDSAKVRPWTRQHSN